MAKLEQLKEQLSNGQEIKSVVRTMKSFAAVNTHHYQKASEAMVEYSSIVEDALAELISVSPPVPPVELPGNGECGIIVLGSDQGLVGSFNEHIAAEYRETFQGGSFGRQRICVLGKKLVRVLSSEGFTAESSFSMPSSAHGLSGALQNIISTADRWNSTSVSEIFIVSSYLAGTLTQKTVVKKILPPDPEWIEKLVQRGKEFKTSSVLPIEREKLLSALAGQYILVEVHKALTESMLCENTLRLIAMQVSEKHIDEFLEELTLASNQERQNSITEELLDIEAGVAAMEKQEAQ